jgi:hypothetical protein
MAQRLRFGETLHPRLVGLCGPGTLEDRYRQVLCRRAPRIRLDGLLRQYFPTGFDFSTVTETDLDAVADELNARPRKRFDVATPIEQALRAAVAMTARIRRPGRASASWAEVHRADKGCSNRTSTRKAPRAVELKPGLCWC